MARVCVCVQGHDFLLSVTHCTTPVPRPSVHHTSASPVRALVPRLLPHPLHRLLLPLRRLCFLPAAVRVHHPIHTLSPTTQLQPRTLGHGPSTLKDPGPVLQDIHLWHRGAHRPRHWLLLPQVRLFG